MSKKSKKNRGAKASAVESNKSAQYVLGAGGQKILLKPAAVGFIQRILRLLFADRAWALIQLLVHLPFFSGAVLASGFAAFQLNLFTLFLISIFSWHYLRLLLSGRLIVKRARLLLISLYFAQPLVYGLLFYLTRSFAIVWLLAIYGLLTLLELSELSAPSREWLKQSLWLKAVVFVLRLCILPILGVYSQQRELFPYSAVLGLVPALFIVAAFLVERAESLEARGYRRVKEVTKKNGEKILRPAALAQAFFLLITAAPALVMSGVVLNILPPSFFLIAALIYSMPSIATAFLEKLSADQEIYIRVLRQAAFSQFLLFIAGVLAMFLQVSLLVEGK